MKQSVKVLFLITAGFLLLTFISAKFTVPKPKFQSTLPRVVEKSLEGTESRYAIYIKNLKTGESYQKNETEVFDAGSLYKLWVMQAIFEKIKKGELKEDDPIEANVRSLNQQFAIEDPEMTDGVLQFSILSAIEQMITISHNYAALALLTKLDQDTVKIPTEISAKEIGGFFEKLYQGEIIDPEYSQKMIGVLSRQKVNDRIPKLLPEGTKVAHKTADLGSSEHDAGIVFSSKGDYIIVILSESDLPQAAGEKIANISKGVYDYFNDVIE